MAIASPDGDNKEAASQTAPAPASASATTSVSALAASVIYSPSLRSQDRFYDALSRLASPLAPLVPLPVPSITECVTDQLPSNAESSATVTAVTSVADPLGDVTIEWKRIIANFVSAATQTDPTTPQACHLTNEPISTPLTAAAPPRRPVSGDGQNEERTRRALGGVRTRGTDPGSEHNNVRTGSWVLVGPSSEESSDESPCGTIRVSRTFNRSGQESQRDTAHGDPVDGLLPSPPFGGKEPGRSASLDLPRRHLSKVRLSGPRSLHTSRHPSRYPSFHVDPREAQNVPVVPEQSLTMDRRKQVSFPLSTSVDRHTSHVPNRRSTEAYLESRRITPAPKILSKVGQSSNLKKEYFLDHDMAHHPHVLEEYINV